MISRNIIDKKTIKNIFLTIFLMVIALSTQGFLSLKKVQAQCYSHYCCGGIGTGGCVYSTFSGAFSCNCDGTRLYCDPGPCGSCNPPGCPTGYGTTNTGCATTTTSCTRSNCHSSCGSSSRTCWRSQFTVTYNGDGGSCSPTSRTVCGGANSAAPSCSRANHNLTGFTRTAGSGGTLTASTGAVTNVTGTQTIRANWALKQYTVTYGGNGGTCSPASRTVNHGSASSAPTCSRPDYKIKNYSLTGTCGGSFSTTTGICSSVTANITVTANWELEVAEPNPPSSLLVNGSSGSPTIADIPPYFSAVFTDPNANDYGVKYQIQVNTNQNFTGTTMWDSGLQTMTNTSNGSRSPNITYNGTQLSLNGSKYYWRIRFADNTNLVSNWSDTAEFTMNQIPTQPTYPETNSKTNPTCIQTTPLPTFSAIFNDPDGHTGIKYQIQVNTNASFTGTTMWDSGLLSMTPIANGGRSPQIEYNGQSLANDGTTYYWRIRFADTYGSVSTWSSVANFTMNTPPTTPTQPLTEGLVNPIDVGTFTPKFSAIFNDSDTCEYIEYSEFYQIQVNTNASFTGSTMWNSGKTSMVKTDKGSRSPDITYAGTTLTLNGATYYWRIKFWDSAESESPWSSTAQFTMETNQTPTAPTQLRVDGVVDNPKVNNTNPKFSAIFNDPNTSDYSRYYEIHVDSKEDFSSQPLVWNTGKKQMSITLQGNRSPDITFDGSTLNLSGVTYYWRIRFWDSVDVVSPWGYGQFKTSGAYTIIQDLQMSGLQLGL